MNVKDAVLITILTSLLVLIKSGVVKVRHSSLPQESKSIPPPVARSFSNGKSSLALKSTLPERHSTLVGNGHRGHLQKENSPAPLAFKSPIIEKSIQEIRKEDFADSRIKSLKNCISNVDSNCEWKELGIYLEDRSLCNSQKIENVFSLKSAKLDQLWLSKCYPGGGKILDFASGVVDNGNSSSKPATISLVLQHTIEILKSMNSKDGPSFIRIDKKHHKSMAPILPHILLEQINSNKAFPLWDLESIKLMLKDPIAHGSLNRTLRIIGQQSVGKINLLLNVVPGMKSFTSLMAVLFETVFTTTGFKEHSEITSRIEVLGSELVPSVLELVLQQPFQPSGLVKCLLKVMRNNYIGYPSSSSFSPMTIVAPPPEGSIELPEPSPIVIKVLGAEARNSTVEELKFNLQKLINDFVIIKVDLKGTKRAIEGDDSFPTKGTIVDSERNPDSNQKVNILSSIESENLVDSINLLVKAPDFVGQETL